MKCSFKPYEGEEAYIFVSYSHSNGDIVSPILDYLNDKGFRIWFDDGIDWGSEWPESIAAHLLNCDVCMAFHSSASIVSQNCRQEIHYAIKNNKNILSVFLEDITLSEGMDMQLTPFQSTYPFRYEDKNEFFERLIHTGILQICRDKISPTNNEYVFSDKKEVLGCNRIEVSSADDTVFLDVNEDGNKKTGLATYGSDLLNYLSRLRKRRCSFSNVCNNEKYLVVLLEPGWQGVGKEVNKNIKIFGGYGMSQVEIMINDPPILIGNMVRGDEIKTFHRVFEKENNGKIDIYQMTDYTSSFLTGIPTEALSGDRVRTLGLGSEVDVILDSIDINKTNKLISTLKGIGFGKKKYTEIIGNIPSVISQYMKRDDAAELVDHLLDAGANVDIKVHTDQDYSAVLLTEPNSNQCNLKLMSLLIGQTRKDEKQLMDEWEIFNQLVIKENLTWEQSVDYLRQYNDMGADIEIRSNHNTWSVYNTRAFSSEYGIQMNGNMY